MIVLVVIAVAIAVVELIVRAIWYPAYFTHGIPVFMMRAPFMEPFDDGLCHYLVKEMEYDYAHVTSPRMAFRLVAPDSIAIRGPVPGEFMHGVIRRDTDHAAATIIGWLNWTPAAAIAFGIWFAWYAGLDLKSSLAWGMIGFFALIVLMLYGSQAWRLRKIGLALAEKRVRLAQQAARAARWNAATSNTARQTP